MSYLSRSPRDTAKPNCFSDKLKWEDWNPSFINFLRSIPGRNGIPLSYVIRSNPLPDPVTHTDFLDDYVAMASLNGAAFEVDSAEVHTYIVKFISGNDTAESKIQSHTITNNGRKDYIALKNHYNSVLMQLTTKLLMKIVGNLTIQTI